MSSIRLVHLTVILEEPTCKVPLQVNLIDGILLYIFFIINYIKIIKCRIFVFLLMIRLQ